MSDKKELNKQDFYYELFKVAEKHGLGCAVLDDNGEAKLVIIGEEEYIENVTEHWGLVTSTTKKDLH